jgi:hypothetical protein
MFETLITVAKIILFLITIYLEILQKNKTLCLEMLQKNLKYTLDILQKIVSLRHHKL